MNYKLDNIGDRDATAIKNSIDKGAQFIVFRYQVSLGLISLYRLSPAILINNNAEFARYRRKYNLITLLAGPWHITRGLYNVYRAIRANNSGGLDVTKDILLNIDFLNTAEKTIDIKMLYTIFDHLPTADFKELQKALHDYVVPHNSIQALYAAKYINTENNTEPPYYIGVDSQKDKRLLEQELKALIYKRFNSFVSFHIFTKEKDPELFEKIKTQGQPVHKKQL